MSSATRGATSEILGKEGDIVCATNSEEPAIYCEMNKSYYDNSEAI